jgi:hypothetical protein
MLRRGGVGRAKAAKYYFTQPLTCVGFVVRGDANVLRAAATTSVRFIKQAGDRIRAYAFSGEGQNQNRRTVVGSVDLVKGGGNGMQVVDVSRRAAGAPRGVDPRYVHVGHNVKEYGGELTYTGAVSKERWEAICQLVANFYRGMEGKKRYWHGVEYMDLWFWDRWKLRGHVLKNDADMYDILWPSKIK